MSRFMLDNHGKLGRIRWSFRPIIGLLSSAHPLDIYYLSLSTHNNYIKKMRLKI